jgi:hypothetical protein
MKKLLFIFYIITCSLIYMSCNVKEELSDLLTFDSNCDDVVAIRSYANLRIEGCPNSNAVLIRISDQEMGRLTEVLCNSSDDCVAVTVNPFEGEPINGYLKKINHNSANEPDSCFYFSKYSSSVCGYVIE